MTSEGLKRLSRQFVVGYSWTDEHIYQLANQGSGAALAGKRALLVVIGESCIFDQESESIQSAKALRKVHSARYRKLTL